MADWTKVSISLPEEGETVDVRLTDERTIKGVEFAGGRFWKYRSGNGGHAYDVVAWRSIKAKKEENGSTESKN